MGGWKEKEKLQSLDRTTKPFWVCMSTFSCVFFVVFFLWFSLCIFMYWWTHIAHWWLALLTNCFFHHPLCNYCVCKYAGCVAFSCLSSPISPSPSSLSSQPLALSVVHKNQLQLRKSSFAVVCFCKIQACHKSEETVCHQNLWWTSQRYN